MEVEGLITAIGTFIAGGGLVGLFTIPARKRKETADAKKDEISNMKEAMESFYGPLVKKQNERIAELTEENQRLRDTINSQQEQINALKSEISKIYTLLGGKARTIIRDQKTGQFKKKEDPEK